MRILGFMQLALLGVTNSLIKLNLPPKKPLAPLKLHAFKQPAFVLYSAAGFTVFLGLYTVC